MANTVNIRTTKSASEMADEILISVNEVRSALKKEELSKSKLIALAIKQINIKKAIHS